MAFQFQAGRRGFAFLLWASLASSGCQHPLYATFVNAAHEPIRIRFSNNQASEGSAASEEFVLSVGVISRLRMPDSRLDWQYEGFDVQGHRLFCQQGINIPPGEVTTYMAKAGAEWWTGELFYLVDRDGIYAMEPRYFYIGSHSAIPTWPEHVDEIKRLHLPGRCPQ